MKYFFTLLAISLPLCCLCQAPYNPDADNDDMITSNDLISFLTYFGNPFQASFETNSEIVEAEYNEVEFPCDAFYYANESVEKYICVPTIGVNALAWVGGDVCLVKHNIFLPFDEYDIPYGTTIELVYDHPASLNNYPFGLVVVNDTWELTPPNDPGYDTRVITTWVWLNDNWYRRF